MKCQRYRKWIEEAASGATLEPTRRAQLDRHLAGCEPCRRTFEAERQLLAVIDQGIGARVSGQPSPEFAARVRLRLAEEGERQRSRAWWMPWAPISAAALAALALLMAGLWLRHRGSRTPQPVAKVTSPSTPSTGARALTQTNPTAAQTGPLHRTGPAPAAARMSPSPEGQPAKRGGQGSRFEVLVEPGQWAAVTNLYRASQAGRLSGEALLEKPTPSEDPFQVQPVEIEPLVLAQLQDPKPIGEDER